MVKDHSDSEKGRQRKMFYLTHFIYGYMASDIWLMTILIVRKETRCRHIGYSYRLTARVFYMHHHTDRIKHTTTFVTPVVEHWLEREIAQWVHPMKDRSDDPSHNERTPLPQSYISLLLFKEDDESLDNTVSYFSKEFHSHERIYSTLKKVFKHSLLEKGNIYLVEEMWPNHLESTPH